MGPLMVPPASGRRAAMAGSAASIHACALVMPPNSGEVAVIDTVDATAGRAAAGSKYHPSGWLGLVDPARRMIASPTTTAVDCAV